jgi:hypothetical protein
MAQFIDEDFNEDQDQQDVNEFADLQEPSGEVKDNQETQDVQDEPSEEAVPEKYKGKSVNDIIKMHQEAEKAMGRQGTEVGELRRLVDDFIKAQTVTQNNKQSVPQDADEEVDFFADPEKAISRAIEKHPKIKEAEAYKEQMKKASTLATLQAKHPDYQQVVANPAFMEWVQGSKVRTELLHRADLGYDVEAADELLSSFKERIGIVEQTKQMAKEDRKQAVKAASTGSTQGSASTSSKKIYRRQDIIDLMRYNPDRYQALAPEIMQAYAEKRVR